MPSPRDARKKKKSKKKQIITLSSDDEGDAPNLSKIDTLPIETMIQNLRIKEEYEERNRKIQPSTRDFKKIIDDERKRKVQSFIRPRARSNPRSSPWARSNPRSSPRAMSNPRSSPRASSLHRRSRSRGRRERSKSRHDPWKGYDNTDKYQRSGHYRHGGFSQRRARVMLTPAKRDRERSHTRRR